MDAAILDELQQTLHRQGSAAALEQLCTALRERKDFDNLFYARLMARRHELGLSPIPTGSTLDIPPQHQSAFEEAIRSACREVGQLYLDEGNIAQAWGYFRMIDDRAPVKEALARAEPSAESDNVDELIRIALYEGLLPRRGFDWVLAHGSLCNAVTTLSQQLPISAEDRHYCVGKVLEALYEELRERLTNEIIRHEGKAPPEASAPKGSLGVIRQLIAGREWLFADDAYHIDFSHLSAAIQHSLELPPGEALERARELCAYGENLSGVFRSNAEPPFEDQYRDYGIYLAILAGEGVEEGIAHFKAKVDGTTVEEVGSGPAEVLVQLLLRLGRPGEALAVARRHLAPIDGPRLAFTADLCQKASDYQTLVEVAREQGNALQFMAGLLGQGQRA